MVHALLLAGVDPDKGRIRRVRWAGPYASGLAFVQGVGVCQQMKRVTSAIPRTVMSMSSIMNPSSMSMTWTIGAHIAGIACYSVMFEPRATCQEQAGNLDPNSSSHHTAAASIIINDDRQRRPKQPSSHNEAQQVSPQQLCCS